MSAPPTRNVSASTTVTAPRPPTTNRSPPAAGPARRARLLLSEFRAFASGSSERSTRRGRYAFSAGSLKAKSTADTAITGYAIHTVAAESSSSSGRSAAAWTTFATTSTRRPIPAIDEHAGDRAEDDLGRQAERDEEARRKRRSGELEDANRQGDPEDPIADHRDQAAGPDEPELQRRRRSSPRLVTPRGSRQLGPGEVAVRVGAAVPVELPGLADLR